MQEHNSASMWARFRAWLHDKTRPAGDFLAPARESTHSQVMAAWEPVTWIGGRGRVNPLLDLPLARYAGMDKNKVWEMFVGRLAEYEATWILRDEQRQKGPPQRTTLDTVTGWRVLSEEDADADYAARLAWWKENQEPQLRAGDPAAAVSVWLWRNGLREKAVDVFAQIWHTVRARQESDPEHHGIGWTADNALAGFRIVAYRDWDDDTHAQFAALFRQRYADPEIQRGLEDLTN